MNELLMLHTDGKYIVNAEGTRLTLRGTNFGGWLMQEGWLSPLGNGELDHTFIAEVEADSVNGAHTPDLAIDTVTDNGLISNNLDTYWQSAIPQAADNIELKLTLDKARTVSSIVLETGPVHTEEYLRGAIIWVGDQSGNNWWQVEAGIDDSRKSEGIIRLDMGEQTFRFIAIRPSEAAEVPWTVANISLCISDEFNARSTLIRRFGEEKMHELTSAFQDNWITEEDVEHLAEMNMNFVRVPVYWMNFAWTDGTIRTDAQSGFEKLDSFIELCGRYGIYVLIDFHGAPGGSNAWASGGQAGTIPTELFTGDAARVKWNQDVTVAIWEAMAARYKDNAAVAAYGLLNEPVLSYDANEAYENLKYGFYDRIYKAVRAIDPDHMVIFEEFGDWSIAENRPERATWENYMFEKHPYDMGNAQNWYSQKALADGTVLTLDGIQNNWNIPLLVGEFCLYYFNDVWDMFLSDMNEKHISWTNWCYKVRGTKFEGGGGNWGYYNTYTGEEPDLLKDSAEEILRKWTGTRTSEAFIANIPMIDVISKRADGSIAPVYTAYDRAGWTAEASAYSEEDPYNPPEYMLDGDEDTRWSLGRGQTAGDYVTIDMKKVKAVDRVELLGEGSDFPGAYKVKTSDDGISFSRVALNSVDIGFGAKMVLLTQKTERARYIKVVLTEDKTDHWWSVREFRVMAEAE